MKIILIIVLLLPLFLTACSNTKKNDETNNYTANRLNSNVISTDNYNLENNETEAINNINTETELSSFSTKIYTPNDEARQNNIRITCSKLNGTVVKSLETFSFCNTVGKATPEEGYQKADIFDKDGNVVKGYGGGNCQISSTLYNALLEISDIEIIERHNHSNKVYYVPLR